MLEGRSSIGRLGLFIHVTAGFGVTQNYTLAYVWYALAARHGDANALANRDSAARRLDAREMAKAQRLAGQLLRTLPQTR